MKVAMYAVCLDYLLGYLQSQSTPGLNTSGLHHQAFITIQLVLYPSGTSHGQHRHVKDHQALEA